MQAMQLSDIDALAIEAEPPAERRHQKADRDDPPAFVPGGGLVDDFFTEAIQHLSLWLFSPSWPGIVVCLAQTA